MITKPTLSPNTESIQMRLKYTKLKSVAPPKTILIPFNKYNKYHQQFSNENQYLPKRTLKDEIEFDNMFGLRLSLDCKSGVLSESISVVSITIIYECRIVLSHLI